MTVNKAGVWVHELPASDGETQFAAAILTDLFWHATTVVREQMFFELFLGPDGWDKHNFAMTAVCF